METVITETNFAEIKSSPVPVLIDFWATWCGPCRQLSPVVDEIAAEYEGRVIVAKCNVDDCSDVASECNIRSIPTLLYFKDGELADRTVGLVSKGDIQTRLDNLLK